MTHSTFEVPINKSLWPEAAKPYANNGTSAERGWPLGYPAMAPAGLWTTPSDLAHFVIEIQKAYHGDSLCYSRLH